MDVRVRAAFDVGNDLSPQQFRCEMPRGWQVAHLRPERNCEVLERDLPVVVDLQVYASLECRLVALDCMERRSVGFGWRVRKIELASRIRKFYNRPIGIIVGVLCLLSWLASGEGYRQRPVNQEEQFAGGHECWKFFFRHFFQRLKTIETGRLACQTFQILLAMIPVSVVELGRPFRIVLFSRGAPLHILAQLFVVVPDFSSQERRGRNEHRVELD